MPINFKPRRATKESARLRMALIGTAGAGKTFTALSLAQGLVPGGKVLVIDTEHGSASKYAGLFNFDVFELDSFSPQNYIECIQEAANHGYDVLILDSLSHAWSGKDGALEMVDKIGKRSQSGNNFAAWRDVPPVHNQLIDAMIGAPMHLIVTMRAKTEYVQERDERTGKTRVRSVGLAPIQRGGMEYEFDVVATMNQENELLVSKSRCPELSGAVVSRPGADVAATLRNWLTDSSAPVAEVTSEPLASVEELEECEKFRLEAVQLGFRTPKGLEPQPCPDGASARVVKLKSAAYWSFIEKNQKAPDSTDDSYFMEGQEGAYDEPVDTAQAA